MGVELIVTGVAVLISAAVSAYAIIQGRKGNDDALQASSDFNPTHAKEGAVFPIVYGRVRLRGGLMYFGRLRTVEIKADTGGKGGGSSSAQTAGFKYYADVWQSICLGKVSLITIFQDDKEKPLSDFVADASLFNDGTGNAPGFLDFKDDSGTSLEFLSHLNPLAHIGFQQWFLGENRQTMPNLEFVVERDLSALSINSPNLATGSNPAAVILDILLQNSVPSSKIDFASFNAAADFYAAQGIGINLVFDRSTTAGAAIQKVKEYVDCIVLRDNEGKYILRGFDRTDTFTDEITEQDITQFSINRKSYRNIKNNFVGTYLSEESEFKQRTVITYNPAAEQLAGRVVAQNVDLKAFRDETTASNRITELMKRSSYPLATIRIVTNWKFSNLLPGEIIRVNHSDYGIVDADFRITKIDTNNIARNEITIDAEQQVETLQDDSFLLSGSSRFSSVKQDLTLQALTHVKAFELPYNTRTGDTPAFVILAAREKQIETNFLVLVSNNAISNFEALGQFTSFSMRGTLDTAYPDTTLQVDDEVGILFTYYNNDPVFNSIAREQMYAQARFALIGDELVTFQNYIPQTGNQVLLTGITRKILATPKQSHAINDEIWLFSLNDNVLENVPYDDFYIKVLPMFLSTVLDASLVTAQNFQRTNKAKEPRNVGRIKATKAGINVTFQLFPSTPGIVGAGDLPESETDSEPPFNFLGDFELSGNVSPDPQIQTSDSFTITPTVFPATIVVKSRLNNKLSSGRTIVIGTVDGDYFG